MDPLIRVKEAYQKGILPAKIYRLIIKRFPIAVEGINRIEKASKINFPIAYVEPSIIVSAPDQTSFQYAIIFARTIPLIIDNKLEVVIQITAPLVAFGLKGTIHAVLAHEFLHYLELIRKVSRMEILSDEITSNLFENIYVDQTRLFEPRAVFNDKTLLSHITRKFPAGFRDYKLEDKAMKFWIKQNLPKLNIALDTNIVKLSAQSIANIHIDYKLLKIMEHLEEKSKKTRRKKLY
jgi:hypothetical protein